MTDAEDGHWSLGSSRRGVTSQPPVEQPMAWAKDRATGQPRYIGELRADQTGAACDCVCYGCGLPLQAVNAGNPLYRRRPSFRHTAGSGRSECLLLASRVAVLDALRREERILLPARRIQGKVRGLSGALHAAWVSLEPEWVTLADLRLMDDTTAIVRLDDGRTFEISLTAAIHHEVDASGDPSLTPRIVMNVADPELAGMTPEAIRERIAHILVQSEWHSHWQDPQLHERAAAAAEGAAADALDWGAPDRETLLHRLTKEILATHKRLQLPDLLGTALVTLPDGLPRAATSRRKGEMVVLSSVELERMLGAVRPDVVAHMTATGQWEEGLLLVEVTVTNPVDPARLARVRGLNVAALEIDIRQLGGMLSLSQFTTLILDEVAGKRWLHHPAIPTLKAAAGDELKRLQAPQTLTPSSVTAMRQQPFKPRSATPADKYPRKWRSGQVITANASVWERMGVIQWRAILSFGESSRTQGMNVADALRACSEKYGPSVSSLRGIWEAAGLIEHVD